MPLLLSIGCNSDYTLERRGGPYPSDPVGDPPLGGSGGAAGAPTTDEGGSGANPEAPILFCDALTVVRNKCQRCHNDPPENGAPVPFLTFEDFHAQYGTSEFAWWEVAVGMVEDDIMPYVALNAPPFSIMPPVEPLTVEEKATLLGWLKQGALPEGGTDCPE